MARKRSEIVATAGRKTVKRKYVADVGKLRWAELKK